MDFLVIAWSELKVCLQLAICTISQLVYFTLSEKISRMVLVLFFYDISFLICLTVEQVIRNHLTKAI